MKHHRLANHAILALELVESKDGVVRQAMVFQVAPHLFDRIQFGGVGREVLD